MIVTANREKQTITIDGQDFTYCEAIKIYMELTNALTRLRRCCPEEDTIDET